MVLQAPPRLEPGANAGTAGSPDAAPAADAAVMAKQRNWWQGNVVTFGPHRLLPFEILPRLHHEIIEACAPFWLRRTTRLKVLKRLAEECAQFGPLVRRKAAELRMKAAQKRLDLLRSGDLATYSSVVANTKETRLMEILDETERIMSEIKAPAAVDAAEVEPPALLAGGDGPNARKMMPHQIQGLRWLVGMTDSHMSGILADDMGLGKTVQTLALLAYLKEVRGEHGPHLIIAPVSTLSHWVSELTSWLPSFKYICFRGSHRAAKQKELIGKHMHDLNVVITSFETAANHGNFFGHFPWHTVVMDEGQRIKNFKTRVSRIVRTFPCRHRLLLTGTPVQNSLRELWSLLSFVAPLSFGSLEDFEQWFALPAPVSMRLRASPGAGTGAEGLEGEEPALALERLEGASSLQRKGTGVGGNLDEEDAEQEEEEEEPEKDLAAEDAEAEAEAERSKILSEEEELLIIQRLHRVLRPFLLRRTKEMVLKDLPEKREVVIWTPLSAWQAKLYTDGICARGGAASGAMTFDLTRLRMTLNHPYHFLDGEAPETGSPEDRLTSASGKFEFLDRYLPRLLAFGHKTLIFAQMTGLLDLLQLLLARRGIRFARIDGSMRLNMRHLNAKRFQTEPDVGVLLLTTRAGGLGLNLQVADTVVLFDSDWNPQVDLQAMDRVYRIGQQKPVLVVRLATPTRLDRGLLERAGQKIDMERKVISAGRFFGNAASASSGSGGAGAKNGGAKDDDAEGFLRRLIGDGRRGKGADAAAAKGGGEGFAPTALDDVARLLARSPEERAAFEAADLELLGPAAAADDEGEDEEGGRAEGAGKRLERSGRLVGASDLRGLLKSKEPTPLPPTRRARAAIILSTTARRASSAPAAKKRRTTGSVNPFASAEKGGGAKKGRGAGAGRGGRGGGGGGRGAAGAKGTKVVRKKK